MLLVRFGDFIEFLSSREGGRIVKRLVLPMLKSASPSNRVIFDLEGVTSISSSFADEFFGKTISEMGFDRFKEITTFRNLNPFVGNVIRNSIYHRNEQHFNEQQFERV